MAVEDLLASFTSPTLVEHCYVKLEVESNHKKLIEELGEIFGTYFSAGAVKDDSTCVVDYTFNISYLGQVERRLRFLLQILKQHPNWVKSIKLQELNRRTILLQEVLSEISTFEEK